MCHLIKVSSNSKPYHWSFFAQCALPLSSGITENSLSRANLRRCRGAKGVTVTDAPNLADGARLIVPPSGLSVQQVIERNLPISTRAGDESSLRTQQQPERTPSKQTTSVCYFHLHILLMVSFVRYKLSVCPANCCCRAWKVKGSVAATWGASEWTFGRAQTPPGANHAENEQAEKSKLGK